MTLDVLPLIKEDKSWNEGMVELPTFRVGNWYWKQYTDSGLFDLDKKWQDYSEGNGAFCCTVPESRAGSSVEAGGGHPQHDEPAAVKKGQIPNLGKLLQAGWQNMSGNPLSPSAMGNA